MEKLRVSDEVVILAGKDKGKKGNVLQIFRKQNRVIVGGCNVVKKAVKPTQENPAGGITEKEAPVHISNVAVVSPKTNKATRVKIVNKDGKNIRVAVSCGTEL
ncbi:MAG: 50S ribosomal protein L24 [Halobacteriovorax sp.]|nr:50S ribosomal protein L24 [Halobacteriovorax sp.]|tara:strand:- start:206676 stop:206984 length:309 start_codon:yes stop_codon:yes gene_type:complete